MTPQLIQAHRKVGMFLKTMLKSLRRYRDANITSARLAKPSSSDLGDWTFVTPKELPKSTSVCSNLSDYSSGTATNGSRSTSVSRASSAEIPSILDSIDSTLDTIQLFTDLFKNYPNIFERAERLELVKDLAQLVDNLQQTLVDVECAGEEIEKVISAVEDGDWEDDEAQAEYGDAKNP